MREELRAVLLKPLWLAWRSRRTDEQARDALLAAGFDPAVLQQESNWVSVESARRALQAMAEDRTLAEAATSFVSHPEALGTWVGLVRSAKAPIDAYRFLLSHSQELTRVGEYVTEGQGESTETATTPSTTTPIASPEPVPDGNRITLLYRQRADEPAEQDDLLCLMRRVLLSGLVMLWGLPPATIHHPVCLAHKGEVCRYEVSWSNGPHSRQGWRLIAVGLVLAACLAGLLAWQLSWLVALLVLLIAAAATVAAVRILSWKARLESERSFERTRLAALERGLELRGDAPVTAQGDLVGTVLGGKYRIGKRIGSGGIGVVHAAEHLWLGTTVAVKVLRGAAAKDGAEIARLRREAQVASALDHPNVVKVFDLDQLQDGSIYLVMELLRGRSLAEKLHRDGPLGPGYAIHVFRQVCLALGAAHDLGVVHRDLKPGNVFLCDDGMIAKVLDFGMSKLAAGAGVGNEKLTQDGYTLGTPEYMAPEQCIGATVEARTDIYELGVLIYEALTGDLPIRSSNRRELLDLHQRQIPPPMRVRRPDLPIPAALDDIVALCLRKRVHERPESARVLERMLASVPLDGVVMHYPRNVGRTPTRKSASEDTGRGASTVRGLVSGSNDR